MIEETPQGREPVGRRDLERVLGPRVRSRAWLVYLVLGAGATALYYVSPSSWNNVVTDAIGLSAVLAILIGVRINRTAPKAPWLAMALGQFLFVTGDVIWTIYEDVLGRESPFPSVADVAYLAGYVPLVVGLILLVRVRQPGRDIDSLIDSALITAGFGVGAWVFLIAPQITTNPDPLSQAVSAAYPLADLLMLGMVIRLVFTLGRRIQAHAILCASLIALIGADSAYLFGTLHGWYATGSVIDAGWISSYVLWGVAALHPSRSTVTAPKEVVRGQLTRPRLASLTVVTLAAPAMLAIQGLRHRPLHLPVMVLAVACVSLLVIARMAGLASALQAAAHHDSLTGLPNRRLLLDRLRLALARGNRSRETVSVLFIDLGGFKAVNDRFGHAAGDDVLVAVAGRLRDTVRAEDTVARFGGDEFIVVCEGLDAHQTTALVDRLRQQLSQPILTGGELVALAVDIGVAVAQPGSDDPERLLSLADQEMYRVKGGARSAPRGDATRTPAN
jgi:diguanylate cyclase (GGDEF)-like protein